MLFGNIVIHGRPRVLGIKLIFNIDNPLTMLIHFQKHFVQQHPVDAFLEDFEGSLFLHKNIVIILLLKLLNILLKSLVDLRFLGSMIPMSLHRGVFEHLGTFIYDGLVIFFLV